MVDLPNMTSPREVVHFMSRYGLKPQSALGQNFLIDGNIVQKITTAAGLSPGEGVLEIGPGAGALTMNLARLGARVLALELDRGLVRLLEDILQPFPDVRVLPGDALKADYQNLIQAHFPPGCAVKLISNLPYYLSSPLMYRIFEQRFPFDGAVLMFQKEVARRFLAEPGDPAYSSLSVLCQYYTRSHLLFPVSKQVFWPRPEVESAVISLLPRPPVLNSGEELLLWRIVKAAFQHRRKTLLNSLMHAFSLPRDTFSALLTEADVDPLCRPESLPVTLFAKLTRIIYNYMGS